MSRAPTPFPLLCSLLLAGVLGGCDLWPEGSDQPGAHNAYHRGRLPAAPEQSALAVRGSQPVRHPRALSRHPSIASDAGPSAGPGSATNGVDEVHR